MVTASNKLLGRPFVDQILPSTTWISPTAPVAAPATFISSDAFLGTQYGQRWLVQDILVHDQPAVIGGAKKVLKTSVAIDLAVSIASGKKFLQKFSVSEKHRVGIISGESGGAVLQETFERICTAKSIKRPKELGVFWSLALPHLHRDEHLAILTNNIREHRLKVVILDPLYLCLLAGTTELQASNLYHIGPLLSRASRACLDAGATPIFAHHTRMSRSTKYDSRSLPPPELSDLAFAAVQEFVRQWILLGRRKKYEPGTGSHHLWMSAGGSAGHSGCWAIDIHEGTLQKDFRIRKWIVSVRTVGEERDRAAHEKTAERDSTKKRRNSEKTKVIIRFLNKHPKGETETEIAKKVGGEKKVVKKLLSQLLSKGQIEKANIRKASGQSGLRNYPGYILAESQRS